MTAGAAEPRSTSDSSSSSTSSKAAGGTPAGGDTGGARSDVPPGVAAAAEVTGKTAARATKAATKGVSLAREARFHIVGAANALQAYRLATLSCKVIV